jgi:hypothetical protein
MMHCKSHTNWFTKSLEKRFSKQSPYAYNTVEFRRSSTQHDTPSGVVHSFIFHLFSSFIYGIAEVGMKNDRLVNAFVCAWLAARLAQDLWFLELSIGVPRCARREVRNRGG